MGTCAAYLERDNGVRIAVKYQGRQIKLGQIGTKIRVSERERGRSGRQGYI